jgi:hypothetical protein
MLRCDTIKQQECGNGDCVMTSNRPYQIQFLSDALVFIQWTTTQPRYADEDAFISEMEDLLDDAGTPLYFLSDLRQGRISNPMVIVRLSQLTRHANWAGSTAFSENTLTHQFVRNFRNWTFSGSSNNEMHTTPDEAIAFLEHLKPGISEGIDWERVLDTGAKQ